MLVIPYVIAIPPKNNYANSIRAKTRGFIPAWINLDKCVSKPKAVIAIVNRN